MIEQRVLRQIETNMRKLDERRQAKTARKAAVPKLPPPKTPKKSVADEIDRLRVLHEQGALTDEQYQRAVDRVLGEG